MKNLLTTFLIACVTLMAGKSYGQAAGVTFISETDWTAESKPTTDGNIISISRGTGGLYDYYLTKLTTDGDIIWSIGIDGPVGYPSLQDIFSLSDGNYVMFSDNYFVKFNSEGAVISDIFFTSEILGYDDIPGDAGFADYVDVAQVDGGFIFYSRGTAAGEDFVAITKLDEDGNSIWSYAYSYDNFNNYAVVVKDEYVYFSNSHGYPDYTHPLTIINSLDGSIVSETTPDEYLYNIDLIKVEDGIIESGRGDYLGDITDVLTKYNFDGEELWTNFFTYTGFDSGYVIEIITLESGNLISLNVASGVAEYEYLLRYYDEFGDTILNVHNFLDKEYFDINDMERNGDELIFSGKYYGLVDGVGFVLITDTLGQFNQLVIQGTVYYDANDNGLVDPEEFTFHDRLITTDPPGNFAFSNAEGDYTMHIYEPGIYSISTENPEYWDIIDPSEYSVEYDILGLEDTLFNKDFRLDYTIPVLDLRVSLYQSGIAPGFSTNSCITIENVGNQVAVDATAFLHHPSGLTYNSGTLYSDYTDTTITWELPDFNPYKPITFHSYFTASADFLIDDIKLTVGSIEPVIGDYIIENNADSIFTTVVAAWDPNHKTVNPAGIGAEGYIDPNTEWLEYTVEFQNVGTAPATFVYIDDVIDTHLDLSSIEILGADHTYWMELSDENRITWHFDNINLPDSASDPAGSIGFVTYKIRVKEDAVVGTVITNTAYIYFDYNPAVITNTTKTTLELPNSIQEFNQYLNVYPNPAGDHILLQLEEVNTSGCNIKIYNINGEVILDAVLEAGQQMIQINSSNYPNGIYFISCSDIEGILKTNAKFIVAH